jgi:hypothetical protein
MYLIQRVTAAPLQSQTLVLEDGSSVFLELYYRPLQQGWFINELSYGDFTIYGVRIVNSPNLLHQFRNLLPFGLGCFSTGNREPGLQEDFISGASKLYILTAAEVAEYTEFLADG